MVTGRRLPSLINRIDDHAVAKLIPWQKRRKIFQRWRNDASVRKLLRAEFRGEYRVLVQHNFAHCGAIDAHCFADRFRHVLMPRAAQIRKTERLAQWFEIRKAYPAFRPAANFHAIEEIPV